MSALYTPPIDVADIKSAVDRGFRPPDHLLHGYDIAEMKGRDEYERYWSGVQFVGSEEERDALSETATAARKYLSVYPPSVEEQ